MFGTNVGSKISERSWARAWATVLRCQESHCLSSLRAMKAFASLLEFFLNSPSGSLGFAKVDTMGDGLGAFGFGSPALADLYSGLTLNASYSCIVTSDQSWEIGSAFPSLFSDRACRANTAPLSPLSIFCVVLAPSR